ncbi:chitooligosaccharidolytic beta-N-acetylglucosaminidase-like [Contarinia nasturtii]|uniref:chitooligosaccharidolytic beta-N-acetylglucosaminidase-like n=1 Tax=Contarinia nasturtii TaxID=265458 RepID=UPI0012D4B570|nr:chitooligosaccharidolytic beta-N-acetylglucosaminidase-like [Contarinia nasturtii]
MVIGINVENTDGKLNLHTNEHYQIQAHKEANGVVVANITAETIFGARHALETMSQLIVFDSDSDGLFIVDEFQIDDQPAFPHRGFLLDTVRNYFPLDSIKRTIDGMAMVKLNVFHWHISDSQSFPMVLISHPEMAQHGAYSSDKVYTIENIKEVRDYAYVRGVLLLPEFDTSAHVSAGWQKNVTTCVNMEPWHIYCAVPACGQLDPTKNHVYDILEDIYREMYDAFGKPDRFHMGGDEVFEKCWEVSEDIRNWIQDHGLQLDTNGFMELWGFFQQKALERMDRVTATNVSIILWTSTLTGKEYVEKHLDKERHIIQIWTKKNDTVITDLLERGYKLILSNYDNFYFDCGFGHWLRDGNNWCSPYKDWKKVYDNDFEYFGEKYKSQFLGGEAALWSEQVDHLTLDGRTWPRLSALAERLWTNPSTTWPKAVSRMLIHRERLAENGIAAERLAPEWCVQHQGKCVSY